MSSATGYPTQQASPMHPSHQLRRASDAIAPEQQAQASSSTQPYPGHYIQAGPSSSSASSWQAMPSQTRKASVGAPSIDQSSMQMHNNGLAAASTSRANYDNSRLDPYAAGPSLLSPPLPSPSLRNRPSYLRAESQESRKETSSQASSSSYPRYQHSPGQGSSAGPASPGIQFNIPDRPPQSAVRPPPRSRVFGLGPDLMPQRDAADPAFFPGGIVSPDAVSSAGMESSKGQPPSFSVELMASGFDHRGYPVYSGRAAAITGTIRMKKAEASDVIVRISAYTTIGAAAAVWDGIVLMPPESSAERVVFSTTDTLEVSGGRTEYVEPSAPTVVEPRDPKAEAPDPYIVVLPFMVNLPLGAATKYIDGNLEQVTVPLPPSFEMSSELDQRERATLRNTSKAQGTASSSASSIGGATLKTSKTKMSSTAQTLKEAVEQGLQQSYRIGCFYRISFSTIRTEPVPTRSRKMSFNLKGSKGRRPSQQVGDTLTVPFVFMGETTTDPPLPSYLPPVRPQLLLQTKQTLAPGWISESNTAKWSGMIFRTLKRNVELEMFLPGIVLQASGVVPFLLIIRPEDPTLLPPAARCTSRDTGASSPSSTPLPSAVATRLSGMDSSSDSPQTQSTDTAEQAEAQEQLASEVDSEDIDTGSKRGGLSRFMRTSLSIGRSSAHDSSTTNVANSTTPQRIASNTSDSKAGKPLKGKTSRSAFFLARRPPSAHSKNSSDGSGNETENSFTVRGSSSGGWSGAPRDLSRLVRVSLVQSIHYGTGNVNETPVARRRLICVADLEEIDLEKLSEARELGLASGGPETDAEYETARSKGTRVLRGTLKIGREATPSFRTPGIDLKYGVKVDLLPFKNRHEIPGSQPRTPNNRPSSLSSHFGPNSHDAENQSPLQSPSRSNAAALPGAERQSTQSLIGSTTAFGSPAVAAADLPYDPRKQPVPGQVPGPSSSATQERPPAVRSSSTLATGVSAAVGAPGARDDATIGAPGTRRTPSDQTTVAAPDVSKLHKTVGALWIGVRLVKGQGSL